MQEIAFALTRVPPARNPINLRSVARVRCLKETHVNGWLRPNVHVDGNPLRLSCPMELHFAEEHLTKPFPVLYALVECDRAGIPTDPALRGEYLKWLKSQYALDIFAHYQDAPGNVPPSTTEQAAEVEAPAEEPSPMSAPITVNGAPAAAESSPVPAQETVPPTQAATEQQPAPSSEQNTETAAAPARPNGRGRKGDTK